MQCARAKKSKLTYCITKSLYIVIANVHIHTIRGHEQQLLSRWISRCFDEFCYWTIVQRNADVTEAVVMTKAQCVVVVFSMSKVPGLWAKKSKMLHSIRFNAGGVWCWLSRQGQTHSTCSLRSSLSIIPLFPLVVFNRPSVRLPTAADPSHWLFLSSSSGLQAMSAARCACSRFIYALSSDLQFDLQGQQYEFVYFFTIRAVNDRC